MHATLESVSMWRKGYVMSRLTSLTIALASAVFLSVPHLATAAGDDQRARARGRSGRTASAPAQTSRGSSRRAPAARSGGRTAKSAPARRAPAARKGRTTQSAPPSRPQSRARRAPVTRSGERQTPPAPAARSGARTTERPARSNRTTSRREPPARRGDGQVATRSGGTQGQTSQRPSRRAPIVRSGGRVTPDSSAKRPETSGATDAVRHVSRRPAGTTSTTSSVSSTRARRREPATAGVTRATQGGRGDSRTTTRQRVGGAVRTEAAATADSVRTVVRRQSSRIVDVNGTRQSDSARGGGVRVGSTTRGRTGVRRAAVAEAGNVVQVATARPNRRLSGQGNVVGRAVPRPSLDGTFRGRVGSRGRGYSSGYRTTSSYGYRYPYDGGRVRFGRSAGFYGRGHSSYGFNLGLSFGSVSLFGHQGYGRYGYGRYGYPGYGYYSYGYPYSPYYSYGYSGNYYGQTYANPYMGSLRLKVKPRDAEVLVDGYYVGLVDHFDGFAQRLRLEEGTYQIEIRHPDYLPIDLDVLIVAGETVTFEEYMVRP